MSERTSGWGDRLRPSSLRPRIRRIADRVFARGVNATIDALDQRVLDRDRLRAVAARDGLLIEYDDAETYEIDPPESPASPEGMVAERVGTHSLPRPFVCELPDCELVGSAPVALTNRGRIVLEATVRQGVFALNVLASLRHLAAYPEDLRGLLDGADLDTACLLYNYWSDGYFHWTYESLIRLEGVERYRERTGRTPTLVLGPDPPTWQRESLELLGYGPDDWIAWDRQRASVDRFVVPVVRRTEVLSPAAVRWLRDRVRSRLYADDALPDPGAFPDRVYVSRADADRRRVRNEDEVVAALSERGFSRFVLSELSVPEQAALFAGADVVVAPHGAGLTNLTYADDPVVVELFRDGDVRGQYFQLAKILGLEYHYLRCEGAGNDVVVDVGDLRGLLRRAGGEEPAADRT